MFMIHVRRCNGIASCDFDAINEFFNGDPCENTPKYFTLKHTCIGTYFRLQFICFKLILSGWAGSLASRGMIANWFPDLSNFQLRVTR